MEGVTTFPMRLWYWLVSAPERMATPFLRATHTFPVKEIPAEFAPELFTLRKVTPYELIPQIMTADAEDFIRSAHLFADGFPHIELNAGCPSPNCVGTGAGSSLLRDPDDFGSMIDEISGALGADRFAVKMRTGFNSHEEFPRLLSVLSQVRIKHLTIHGRTRPQGYKGRADWHLIDQAASRLPYPVLASGDITDRAGLQANMQRWPRIAGALIGRGALRQPWIFEEIRSGTTQSVDRETMVFALATFGVLQELAHSDLPLLITMAADGVFTEPCRRDGARWRAMFARVSSAAFGRPLCLFSSNFSERYILERRTAGRLKLLWNYIRSSLPPAFFEPMVMRSPTPAALLQAIQGLFPDDQPVAMTYQPHLDWIYNGEKNERQAAAQKDRLLSESEPAAVTESCALV
jgi:tRNA-dihydrouridine synthase